MNNIGSPLRIGILLNCHTTTGPHPCYDATEVQEALQELLDLGAIKANSYLNEYDTTPLGAAWVKALCNVPVPKQVFVDEQGRILE